MNLFFTILLIWNICVMSIYGLDKLYARRGTRRIKERTLILLAFLAGSVGAMFGMVIFNHKTSKQKFRYLVPLSVILNISLLVWIMLSRLNLL